MISIITPVFKGAKFIKSCIESVASQYFEGLEHLIMDGGSPDGTAEIVKELMLKYPHIRLVSEPDKGQSDAMNKGIHLASNPVISFLNADDRYEPGALALARDFFKTAPNYSFLLGNCKVIDEDGSLYMVNKPWPFDRVAFMLDYLFPYNPSAYFYHRSLHDKVGFYAVEDHLTMDIDFLFRLKGKAKVFYVDEILGNYWMLPESKTMQEISAGRNVENLKLVFQKYLPELSVDEKFRYYFQKMLGKNRGWIKYYLQNPGQVFSQLFRKFSR
jgi:glycosyltransferase involved in cell wall biosynthesis